MSENIVPTAPQEAQLSIEGSSTAQTTTYPGLAAFVRAQGCWFFDARGKRYFDCTSGSGALNLGHNHPRIVSAAIRQTERLIHTGSMIHAEVRDQLISKLGHFSPYHKCAILLTVIGTEAIEAALKVARAYTGRRTMIAFKYAYHGKSSGGLSVTWRERYKQFSPLPQDVVFSTSYPVLHSSAAENSSTACLRQLDIVIQEMVEKGLPPAAIILEPVECTEGILPSGNEFLEGVIQIAHKVGALVIFDEIWTGFGRCGTSFYSARPGLKPDLMVVGKALGNGFPISAVMGPPSIIEALPAGLHTSTFAGNPVACAVACEVIDVMQELQPWQQAAKMGNKLRQFLDELESEFSYIASVRGEGLMLGFDCVDDRNKPLPNLAQNFAMVALAKGLIIGYGGFHDSTIKITPPLTIDDEAMQFLIHTLFDVANDIKRELLK